MRFGARCIAGLTVAGCILGLAPRAFAQEPPAAQARVHFEAATADTDFHVRIEDARRGGLTALQSIDDVTGYARVCTGPCDATLGPGTYRLALSATGRTPLEPAEEVTIQGPSKVTGSYTSRRGLRIAGWAMMGGGLAVGTALAIAAATRAPSCDYPSGTLAVGSNEPPICTGRPQSGPFWGAAAAFGAVAVVGLVLALQHDSSSISVTSMDAAGLVVPPRRESGELTLPAGSAPGLGIVARW